MSQQTRVLIVPSSEHSRLRESLGGHDFEFRPVPHAVFSAKGAGVVLTLYKSGKLVVQGADPDLFLARYTELEVTADATSPARSERGAAAEADDEVARLDVVTTGSDETGKGDYFGPLVVAAVRVEPSQVNQLLSSGITDSKRLTDGRALQLGAYVREAFPFAIECLEPEDYNREYSSYGNLNPLLANLHARAIRQLAGAGERVVVDQFGGAQLMRKALAGSGVELQQAPRGERNPAVAAASVIARQEFLVRLGELSAQWDLPLPKGAGTPVDRAGVAFARRFGLDELEKVAKTHFRTTDKIRARVH